MTIGRKLLNKDDLLLKDGGAVKKGSKKSSKKGSKIALKKGSKKGSKPTLKKGSKLTLKKGSKSTLKKSSKRSNQSVSLTNDTLTTCPLHNFCNCRGKKCICNGRQRKTSKKNVIGKFKLNTNI